MCLSPASSPTLLASPLPNGLDELMAGSTPRAAMSAGSMVARPVAMCLGWQRLPYSPHPSQSWAWETLSPSCQGQQMEGWQRLLSLVQFHEHVLNTSSHWGCEAAGGPTPGPPGLGRRLHTSLNMMGMPGKILGWTTNSS